MIKSIVKAIILGRQNGIRRKLFSLVLGDNDDSSDLETTQTSSDIGMGVAYGGAKKMEPPKDVTPPEGYEVVLHFEALQDNEVTEVIIGGQAIAVAKVAGKIYALENTCPHAGGPLSEGEIQNESLSCPYHGWGFDVNSGECQTNPEYQVNTFQTHVEGDAICVKV